MNSKPRVVVMMGGPSSEHEVSMASGAQVLRALRETGLYDVTALVISREGEWRLSRDVPQLAPQPSEAVSPAALRTHTMRGLPLLTDTDVVFLALHGVFGEDGTLQGLLKSVAVPFTGSGPLASALAMNKAMAKQLFRCAGLSVARGLHLTAAVIQSSLTEAMTAVESTVGYPCVVKPNLGGSSLGVSLVESREELAQGLTKASRYDADVLVEEKLLGRELTCAVLEELDGSVKALPVIEIVPRKGKFFDFASKYEDQGSEEICPAPLTDEDRCAVQDAAVRAHQALGCRGFSRTDIFLTDRGPVVLEVNTIPGMTPNSLLPKAARAAGIPFAQLLVQLVQVALRTS
ncbi:MAG: D-alanine--D-alanine ligase [Firmicutes bacterium]|nr:D-alanine--D-alanine ligase [Bacillota bacterium]